MSSFQISPRKVKSQMNFWFVVHVSRARIPFFLLDSETVSAEITERKGDVTRKILSPFLDKRNEEEKRCLFFMEKNGSALHEELVTTFNGRHKVPIGIFTAKELIQATNNFIHPLENIAYKMKFFKGSLEEHRHIVVWEKSGDNPSSRVHNIVMTSQMSHHKNVWKLLGCCLELEVPALVYEYNAGFDFLDDLLFNNNVNKRTLSWTSRLSIASDIANVIVYLHMAFPTPIIYRLLGPYNVVVDQHGVAKLFNFSRCISLPPGKLDFQVEECVTGFGAFIAPEYMYFGVVSQKTDVYAFGLLLVLLLTGKPHVDMARLTNVSQTVLVDEFLDPMLMHDGGGGTEQEQQIQAILQLALKCIKPERTDRPEMIDVARELKQMRKSHVHSH